MDVKSDELFLQGVEAYEAERYEEAVEILNASLKENIKNWEARMYLGSAQYRLGHYEDAGRTFRDVTKMCPELSLRMRANKALEAVEQHMSLNQDDHEVTLAGVLVKPSEEFLQKVYEAAKAAAESPNAVSSEEDAEPHLTEEEIERVKKRKRASGATPALGVEAQPAPVQAQASPPGADEFRKPLIPDAVGIPLIAIAVAGMLYWAGSFLLGDIYNGMFLGSGSEDKPYSLQLPSGMQQESVSFIGPGGVKMNALYVHGDSKEIVLINRATTGSIADDIPLVEALAKTGASVFIYEYRGVGKSEGKRDIRGALDDGLLAYAHVHGVLKYDYPNILEYGDGIGSAVAAELDRRSPGRAVVLVDGFDNLLHVAKQRNLLFNLYPDSFMPTQTLSNVQWARQHSPCLLVTKDNDDMIPQNVTKEFYATVGEPRKEAPMHGTDFREIASYVNDI